MRRIIILMTVFLAFATMADVALAEPRRFDPASLKDLGLIVNRGSGRVNGTDLEVAAISAASDGEALLRQIAEAVRGRFTTSLTLTEHAYVLTIADIRSDQCPDCTRLTPWNIAPIAEATYVFTAPVGGPAPIIGSMAGRMIATADALPQVYEGRLSSALFSNLRIEAQATWRFGDSMTHTTTLLVAPEDADRLRGQIAQELGDQGFASRVTEGERMSAEWTSSNQMIAMRRLDEQPEHPSGAAAGLVRIMIHELAVP